MYNAKILLIDDNVSVIDSLSKNLQDVYSIVRGVKSLEDAVKLLKKDEYDVIVFHTVVDGDNGFKALKRFRSCDSYHSIIAYSNSPDVEYVMHILKNGASDFLVAPFSVDKLKESINSGIEKNKHFAEILDLKKKLEENKKKLELEKENLKNKNNKLQALSDITKAITCSLKLDDALHKIINSIHDLFLFDRIAVSLIDMEKGVEEPKITIGYNDKKSERAIKKLSWDINDIGKNPWMDTLIKEKKVVKVEDPLEDERYKDCEITKYYPKTFIKVPLISEDCVVGSLTFDNIRSNREISDDEINMVKVFAGHAVIAIEKAKFYEKLKSAQDQLNEMQKKIIKSERLMAISEMAVSVNHEINNPLCSLSLSVEILKKELEKSTAPIKEKLNMIEIDIERIKNITSQLASIQDDKTTEYTPDVKMLDIKKSLT